MKTNRKYHYNIIETACYPNRWKVVPVHGIERNASCFFHPKIEKAREMIEQDFRGKVIDVVYLEN